MDKIIAALGKLLPDEEVRSEVAGAVNEMLEEAKGELEKEYSSKLEEAYAELSEELKGTETTAEQGYQEAYSIIQDLRNRLDTQRVEFESHMDENFEQAYQLLVQERGKNENIEVDMYEEFDKRLSEMKEYMVDKVDQFLQYKGSEIYEQARRDIMNDPAMVEHKIVLDRIVDNVAGYISDEDYALATSSKLDEANKTAEELKAQNRILEARSIRLSTENTKLNEAVRSAQEVITEATSDKKERLESAKNVQGRGKTNTEKSEVIAEYSEGDVKPTEEGDNTLVESLDPDFLHAMQVLAGTTSND